MCHNYKCQEWKSTFSSGRSGRFVNHEKPHYGWGVKANQKFDIQLGVNQVASWMHLLGASYGWIRGSKVQRYIIGYPWLSLVAL